MKKILLLFVAMFVTVASFAQVTTSAISGKVTDSNGQALIGATVYAVHTPSGTDYGVASNLDGHYTIQGMRTGGPYTVTVSYVGYQTVETTDIILSLGDVTSLNVELAEGHNIDEIVVAASSSSMFNASKTGAASNFTADAIASTPSVSRSVYDVVALSPLANSTGSGISFAGSNNRYNSFQIDGAVSNDVFGLTSSGTNGGHTGSNAVSLDAIEEIQVVVAPYDVRQSGFTGGGINAITKSGTNTISGSAYAYYTDENLYGTTAGELAEGASREKADTHMTNILGFTIGGPIIKDKLFAFVSFERSYSEEPITYTPGDNYLSTEDAQAIIDRYKEITGITETYGNTKNELSESYDLMARIDWNISQSHKFTFRYQMKDAYSDNASTYYNEYTFDNSQFSYVNRTHSVVAELNSRFSNNVSNEFRVGYTAVRDVREVDYLATQVTIEDVDFNGVYGDVNIGSDASAAANALNQDVITITNNVSIYKGDHTLTFGTHNEIYSLGNTYVSNSTGSYTYGSLEAFLNGDAADSYSYSYALNCANQDYMPYMNAAQFGLYAQDEWKPNNNFTLTYGLRIDLPVIFNSPLTNEAFNNDEVASANGTYSIGSMPSTQILWSPRVGFRYFLDENHNQLLRGGTGIFTGRVPFVWLHNAFNNTGVDKTSIYVSGSSVPDISDTPVTGLAESKQTVNTISDDFKYPQVFRTNLAYEHIFESGWKVTLEGLYSKTLNNVAFRNVALTDSGDKFYAVTADAANDNNTQVYYNSNSSDYYAIINLENTNKGYSYNLSAMVEKSFAMGINLMASYTFGHSYSVNDGSSSVAYSNWVYNYATNVGDMNELGYSYYDTPHRISASVNYNSPLYGRGRWNTVVGLTYNGASGFRYNYCLNDYYVNINGDGVNSNTLLYIPTDTELDLMKWDSDESKEKFKAWIEDDKYASSHRGQYADRYAGLTDFEHHFNLHLAQNYIYNKEKGSRIELSMDIMNIGNLINRNWGMYTASTYNLQPLSVKSIEKVSGGYEATYSWNSYYNELSQNEYNSRWYMQLGVRVTF